MNIPTIKAIKDWPRKYLFISTLTSRNIVAITCCLFFGISLINANLTKKEILLKKEELDCETFNKEDYAKMVGDDIKLIITGLNPVVVSQKEIKKMQYEKEIEELREEERIKKENRANRKQAIKEEKARKKAEKEALEILKVKPNLRILLLPTITVKQPKNAYDIKKFSKTLHIRFI